MSELILYRTDKGQAQLTLRTEDVSVWLIQLEIAELFATERAKKTAALEHYELFDAQRRHGDVVAAYLESLLMRGRGEEGDKGLRAPELALIYANVLF
ncbi:hypothetical protein [Zoogloea sp.]|uniref:hypothetical protein n=1 Tax=Zoogloea sp. TaxID=49181 RepID=UPI0035B21AA3